MARKKMFQTDPPAGQKSEMSKGTDVLKHMAFGYSDEKSGLDKVSTCLVFWFH
jgi:hypothetical protein